MEKGKLLKTNKTLHKTFWTIVEAFNSTKSQIALHVCVSCLTRNFKFLNN